MREIQHREVQSNIK